MTHASIGEKNKEDKLPPIYKNLLTRKSLYAILYKQLHCANAGRDP